jgi:hypothetical protein
MVGSIKKHPNFTGCKLHVAGKMKLPDINPFAFPQNGKLAADDYVLGVRYSFSSNFTG